MGAQRDLAPTRSVLQGVLDQVCRHLHQQIPIPFDERRIRDLQEPGFDRPLPPPVRKGVGDMAGERLKLQRLQTHPARRRFRSETASSMRVEGADDAVDLLQRRVPGSSASTGRCCSVRSIRLLSMPARRRARGRAQVVRNVGGLHPQLLHGLLKTFRGGVDPVRHDAEVIGTTRQRYSLVFRCPWATCARPSLMRSRRFCARAANQSPASKPVTRIPNSETCRPRHSRCPTAHPGARCFPR